MKILICGNSGRTEELQGLITGDHDISVAQEPSEDLIASKEDYDVFFDLNADDHPEAISPLLNLSHKPVFLSSVKKQTAEMVKTHTDKEAQSYLFGINALPGFMKRGTLEISMFGDSNQAYNLLTEVFQSLDLEFQRVDDRVGMVTPRVVFMIINEACFTLQEGTANKQDIDESLKLGTNYPYGPFEWADMIGVKEVYETLHAIYNDTGDERYKVCPLLKTHYLKNLPFFS